MHIYIRAYNTHTYVELDNVWPQINERQQQGALASIQPRTAYHLSRSLLCALALGLSNETAFRDARERCFSFCYICARARGESHTHTVHARALGAPGTYSLLFSTLLSQLSRLRYIYFFIRYPLCPAPRPSPLCIHTHTHTHTHECGLGSRVACFDTYGGASSSEAFFSCRDCSTGNPENTWISSSSLSRVPRRSAPGFLPFFCRLRLG